MNQLRSKASRWRQIGLITTFAVVTTAVMLFVLTNNARGLKFINGAYGCGAFEESIRDAVEGKMVIPMVPSRASNGVVISKSIAIQGGWDYPPAGGDCAGLNANPFVTGTQGLRDAGFVFTAPLTRSALFWDQEPILTLDTSNETLFIEHMSLNQDEGAPSLPSTGGGIDGVINNNAHVRLYNVEITDTQASTAGGGLYLEVRGGSHLHIEESIFGNNTADRGGAFEIHVYDNSHVTINASHFSDNQASSGSGGAGRIVLHNGGTVTVTNSVFRNNSAGSSGGALSIVGTGGAGTVWLVNNSFNGNSAPSSSDVAQSGSGVTVHLLNESIFLPAVNRTFPPTTDYARITDITLNANYDYVVAFETDNFTPALPGQHVHFFFNTVPPAQAGVPGSGPWKLYGGSSPFTGYNDTDRPPFATELCILVANANHSVQQNTGNCYRLPVNR